MDFKTTTSSECEKWVHALRELLKTCTLKIEKVEKCSNCVTIIVVIIVIVIILT